MSKMTAMFLITIFITTSNFGAIVFTTVLSVSMHIYEFAYFGHISMLVIL